ncbi:MAG TPA: FG-GAP-like repeat-containing protein [Thermoanaerobaculia bacterium]|nr:FG-GAP-like repeat-containing protein [Thermoanaerobaculia bacterium]
MFKRYFAAVVLVLSSASLYAAQETRFEAEKVRQLRGNVRVGGKVTLANVPVADGSETMELERFEVFAKDAELMVEGEGGVRTRIAPPNVKYYRGSLAGDPDSWVFLAVREDGAMDGLMVSSQHRFALRSNVTRGARGEVGYGDLVVRELDLIDELPSPETGDSFSCELEGKSLGAAQQFEALKAIESKVTENGTLSGTATYTLNLALETDYEMYQKFGANGSSAANIAAWIGNLVGAASTIYQRDLRTDLVVAFTRIATSAADPFNVDPGSAGVWNGLNTTYTTSHALAELGDIWHDANTRPYNGARSSVVLLSGKTQSAGVAWTGRSCLGDFSCSGGNCGSALFDGHTGGAYAYVGGVGTANGTVPDPTVTVNGVQYGLPSSNYWSLLGFAHELGHNVNGPHTHCVALTPAEQTQYNTTRTYIDQCYTAGGCYAGATSVPAEKGTIMSYCHLSFSGAFPQSRFLFGKSTEPSQKMVDLITSYISGATPNSPAISTAGTINAGAAGSASIVSPVAGLTYTWTLSSGTINGSNVGTSINFTAPASGSFQVRVRATNTSGCAASDYVNVTVNAAQCVAPGIITQPASAVVSLGNTTTLSVTASGTTPSYAWYFGASGDTSRPVGVTTSSLPAGRPSTELFWVRVSNNCGSVNSGTAVITTIGSGVAGANAIRVRPNTPAWRMVGVGDFNADARQDILLQNASAGTLVVWTMMGGGVISTENFLATQVSSVAWRAIAVADFNNDARPDILLQNTTSRAIYVWTMNSNFTVASTENYIGTSASDWSVVAAGDLNNDNSQDLVLSNSVTRQNAVWRLSGLTVTNTSTDLPSTAAGWVIAAVADLSGDGFRDLVLRNAASGANVVWRMNNYAVVSTEDFLPSVGDSSWRIVGPADWNGDGRPDLLWQSSATDESAIWLLNNFVVIAP